MSLKLVTIGAYGFEQERFFQTLRDEHIDVFCDLRAHRSMRGSRYSFLNSQRLQCALGELEICYQHVKELAPDRALRQLQKDQDRVLRIDKRKREKLGENFIHAYEQERLLPFDAQAFLAQLVPEARVIGLFCVEREPDACHRSLVARHWARELGLEVEHILS